MPYSDYPQSATNNAKRAIKHREDNASDCGTSVGWETARILANREEISHDRTVRAYSFLSRAKVYDQGKYFDDDGNEICGSVMYDAWGGDPMLDWAKRKVEEMDSKNINKEAERRTYRLEMRAATEGRTIEGYAALYNSTTDLGWFMERIEPGAFDGSDMSDVVALFNHDPNFPLARTSSGTLSLELDDKGLKYKFEVPNTSYGNDLLESIKRGDISQSSFAFTIDKQKWVEEQDKSPLRVIERVGVLFDVSPVTYPAYKDTSVSARSLEEFKALQNKGVCDKDYPQLIADILEFQKK